MYPRPTSKVLVDIYRRVARIKQNDARLIAALKAGKFAATYYSPRGQEIIPAAISVNLSDADYIVTIYRGLHDQIAKGLPLRALWAEYAGKATGACKGKGGPMHITYPDVGIMVTTGIVGSGLPIANGLALGSQIKGDGRVTVCYFGDGASNIGAFHEALNLAAVWKLPVVFVCQNNGYAEHTRFDLGTASAQVADRAASYRMAGVRVDGNDPVAVWSVARDAIAHARSGKGPTLVEATTFRLSGHLLGDQSEYMTAGEMESAIKRDPVPTFRAMLVADKHASETELAEMEQAIEREINEALEFAMASAYPELAETRIDVYSEEVPA